jgi:hypothetical protein
MEGKQVMVSIDEEEAKKGETEGRKTFLVKEVVKLFPKFREKHINYFIGRGVISYPIGERDLEVLVALHRIWGTKEIVRFNLRYFSRKRKLELLEEALAGCETRFEVWLYARVKEKIERGEKVYVNEMVQEAVRFWKLKKRKRVLENIRKKVRLFKHRLLYNKKKDRSVRS